MSFKLKINDKTDQKLLQNFPKDPYSDIRILTEQLELDLSLAYLSIDSQYFAELPSDLTEVDLSHLNEQFLVYVLRALYGGDLQVSTVHDLAQIYKIVDFLSIDQYKNSIRENLRKIHQAKKDTSPFNLIEMLQFCVKSGVLKEQILNYHFENRLKVLQSSKNYLQLDKITSQSLNEILLAFSSKQGEKGDNIINHILQNYFNRKSYKPAEYFSDSQLLPLRLIWEKFHHKLLIRANKLQKTTSINQLKVTTPAAFLTQLSQPHKFGQLSNIPAIQTQSVNLGIEHFRSEKIGEQHLDIRLQVLAKELEQKNKKIASLQAQMKELMQIKAQREAKSPKGKMQGSIQDLTLFKNMMKSRKSREQQLRKGQNSVSTSQVAYDNVKKAVQQQRQGKIKVVSKTSLSKKMFN